MRQAVILQICHLVRKRYLFLLNLAELGTDRINLVHLLFHDGLKNLIQSGKRYIRDELLHVDRLLILCHLRRNGRLLKKDTLRIHLAVTQLVCHTFVHLVLQKLLYQFRTRILFFLVLRLRSRKKHAGFDVNECRRHDKEFAYHIQVLTLHLCDVFHILIRDLHNRNIIDIYFILLEQVQKQI